MSTWKQGISTPRASGRTGRWARGPGQRQGLYHPPRPRPLLEGWVSADGRMHRHRALAPDVYIGQVESFLSFAHSAAAMLLLVLPALEEARRRREWDRRISPL
ncbi:MAG: hypothetical protein R2911_21280 [Caldilineaceae bacterium]